MSMQFYSVPSNMVQNVMGGGHLHTPQSIFDHTMSHPTQNQQSEAPWFRMPQVPPMSMPWSIPSHQQPDLIRFTGERQHVGPILHQKRKLETPDIVDTRPTKQLITEEKMAQHFQGLYISPNAQAQAPTSSSSSSCDISQNLRLSNSSAGLPDLVEINDSDSTPRLIISEELKKLHQEPILPNSLLSKLERPSMALVLWEPPSKRLLPVLSATRDVSTPIPTTFDRDVEDSNNSNNNNTNNNNEIIPDLNQTMDVNMTDLLLEPMDL